VLVVDDYPDGRDLVAEYLTFKRFDVLTASTAADAIEIIKHAKPQIVLMDLGLPGLDGWDATRMIKADPETSGVVVIALTARVMPQDVQRAFLAGCDGVITKPVDLTTLADVLRGALKRDTSALSGPGISFNPRRSARRRQGSLESL